MSSTGRGHTEVLDVLTTEGGVVPVVDGRPVRRGPASSFREVRAMTEERSVSDKPSVIFVCVHNAGRSQMAAGFMTALSGGAVEVRSAGSAPADQINPTAVRAMAEVGIDITAEQPKVLTPEAVQASDAVITMGCGDACPFYPGKRYEDWVLEDPAGQGIEAVRPIRDEIRARVQALLADLLPAGTATSTVGSPARGQTGRV